jgi:hypothetical protein
MSTMSTNARRQRRLRAVAHYGVTLATLALVVALAQIVGHEAGNIFANVSQGLSY